MKRIFALLLIPVLLFLSVGGAEAISVSADSCILIEPTSGIVLFEKNADDERSMASTTKIMTAIVAIESADLHRRVTVTPEAVGVEGSSIYLFAGETLTLEQLLYALLLSSANDAAVAIAIAVGGSVEGFADLMNQKAAALSLTHTHFDNPNGLDSDTHYTTARDLATLAAYAMQNETFRTIVSTRRTTIPLNGTDGVRLLRNHNRLLGTCTGCLGIKTGFTRKSGRCLVSATQREGVTLIAVTLSAPDDWSDHRSLYDYGFSQCALLSLCSAGEFTDEIPVIGGTAGAVKIHNTDACQAVLLHSHGVITITVERDRFLYAPVNAGETVGRLVYSCDGKEIAATPLIADADIPALTYPKSFWQWLCSLFGVD